MITTVKAYVLCLVFLLVTLIVGAAVYDSTSDYREKTTYEVTMTDAYSSVVNVGKTSNKQIFRGRFLHVASNKVFDRDIDGFFYNKFLDNGKKPLPATVSLTRIDLGEQPPAYMNIAFISSSLSCIMLIVLVLFFLLGGIELKSKRS